MNARQRLDQYLEQVRSRLRRQIVLRAAATVAVLALAVTVIAVWLLAQQGFPSPTVIAVRVGFVLVLAAVAIGLLWLPLRELHRHDGARQLERHLPEQGGRVQTYLDARRRPEGLSSPLVDLLAEDAAEIAARKPPEDVVPPPKLLIPGAAAAVAFVALAGLIFFGSSYWGAGSRHLWFGAELPVETIPIRSITVTPGNAKVRVNQDLPIRAEAQGFKPSEATVHVRFGNAQQWESAPMRANEDGKFEFTLIALREPATYYVSAGSTRSAEHRIEVIELPRIERMRLTYVYPEWTGLKSQTEEDSRDISAVEGTRVELEIETSAPLDSPSLVVNGASDALSTNGTRSTGTITVDKPGTYHISARVGDDLVPLSDEYEIRITEDQKPSIEIAKPGRDWRASNIEEVPIRVRATDDFRVQRLELRYAVNGGEWKTAPLVARSKDVETETILRLEEIAGDKLLAPGDLVTYYAVARDRGQAAQTDLFLIQVQPFERRFTQSQQGGGGAGAGGGDQPLAISERQREILLATWNLERQRAESSGSRQMQRLQDNARMLSELQNTLAQQAQTLVERTRARMLTEADPQIRKFVESLELASQAMKPAALNLNAVKLKEAIPDEQKALQHLLRAEALINEIQVSFQQQGAGGGSNAGRDLAEMFELEMDLEKNQYEMEKSASLENNSEEMDELARRLRELARRQERLAQEQQRNRTSREEERWRQEQLRREAEELRRRLEQLAQRGGGQQSSRGGQNQNEQGGGQSAAEQALEQLEKAIENMGGSAGGSQQANNSQQQQGEQQGNQQRSAQEASRNLQRALERIQRGKSESVASTFESFGQRASQLREQQRRSEEKLREGLTRARSPSELNSRGFSGLSPDEARALAQEKRELQQQLQALQRDMQAAAQKHRKDAPNASRQLKEAAQELAESGAEGRLGRSAVDLERGRPLDAASREGLINEALASLERGLEQAARTASNEARGEREDGEATADELLAELGELRRAWQNAQRDAERRGEGGAATDQQSDSQQSGSSQQESQGQRGSGNGQQPGESQQGGSSGRAGDRGGVWGGVRDSGGADHIIEGRRGRLDAWNPPLAPGQRRPADPESFRREAEEFAKRLQSLQQRLPEGTLPANQIAALRELQRRLRGSPDPMEAEYAKMIALVDQLELAALQAKQRTGAQPPTRAVAPVADSPRYRENVAEYYRRLGDGRSVEERRTSTNPDNNPPPGRSGSN